MRDIHDIHRQATTSSLQVNVREKYAMEGHLYVSNLAPAQLG